MKGYLLDTSAISILDPRKGLLTPKIDAWFTVREPRLYLPAVAVFESTQGVEQLRLAGKDERAKAVEAWLQSVLESLGDRVLSVDRGVAEAAGRMSALAWRHGEHPGVPDIMIAATAQVHGLLLLTRNLKHFVGLGIDIADPTAGLPR